ncbi:MAG: hypothetical protein ACJAT7_001322 [Psychromonas sp.]
MAAVILFSSIATVSMIYSGAFLSSEKANKHIKIAAVLPSVLAAVKSEIQQQGNGNELALSQTNNAWDVTYEWQASLLKHKAAQPIFDTDTGKMTDPPQKFKLWMVELTLEYSGLTKNYHFNELSWNDD